MHGFHGKYLHIDAGARSATPISLAKSVLRKFPGGSALGTWLLLKHGAADCDPLAADASLVFAFSPLVGSPLTTSAKFAVVSKSPLTGRINDSLASSAFAISGKKTGFDAIVITGCANEQSVLLIDNGEIRIEPAGDIGSTTTDVAQQLLREKYGASFKSAVIGPAGENLVRYATISHDGRHAGRGGSGAVLGSKNLKAVLVRGDQLTTWAEPDELVEYARRLSKKSFGPATAKYRELGTASNLLVFNRLNCLPTRNFQESQFEDVAALSPEVLNVTLEKTRDSCAACTIGCEHIYTIKGSDKKKSQNVRLEYENLFALGPLCGVSESEAVLQASLLCDQLGIDTISAGGSIAFAMECQQRGLIDQPQLVFGDAAAMLAAIRQVAVREGFGDLLAEGSRNMAQQIGGNSIDFAPQVKGLELPGYDPRTLQTTALGFAVGTRGADHNRSGAYEADFSETHDRLSVGQQSAAAAVESEDRAAIMDSLILCKFLRGVFDDFYADAAKILALTTGNAITAAELKETAGQIVNAKKLFNLRCGWQPDEDTLPERFFRDSAGNDAASLISKNDMSEAIVAYNRLRGWTDDGHVGEAEIETFADRFEL